MEKEKKTNIIAITDFTEYGDAAVRYASVIAGIFQSSLTIIGNFVFHKLSSNKLAEKQDIFSEHFKKSLENLSDHQIETTFISEMTTHNELLEYAEETSTVMFVIGVSKNDKTTFFNRKKAFSFIKPSRFPVLVVGNKMPDKNIFKEVMLPLDIYLNSKEKAMWAGYFNRFYQSPVHILFSVFKDEFLRKKVKDNLDFVKKLYENLQIEYHLHPISPAVDNIDFYSLKVASQFNATLTVIMMTRFRSLIDIIFGVKEKKMIGNKEGFPVLCLNERKDLYVLCT